MIWHRESSEWFVGESQDDVTSSLTIKLLADLIQSFDDFAAGHCGQFAHWSTSTTSSEIDGGIGSP